MRLFVYLCKLTQYPLLQKGSSVMSIRGKDGWIAINIPAKMRSPSGPTLYALLHFVQLMTPHLILLP